MTEPGGPTWRQTTFFPFSITSRLAGARAVRVPVRSGTFTSERFGAVANVNAVATIGDDGSVSLFVVNRSVHEAVPLTLDVSALGDQLQVVESHLLSDEDIYAANTLADTDRVRPTDAAAQVVDGLLRVDLPAVSWAAIRLISNT